MILIINICKEKLHYFEFVKPIEDILKNNNIKFFTKDYTLINKEDLKKANKVIICGTSLKNNKFIEDLDKFSWIEEFNKPILGICGGMQIILLLYGGELKKEKEIGFSKENFKKEFLGVEGEVEVYHLHNNSVDFFWGRHFDVFSSGKIVQAIKHKEKEIYGVLFHPEVRNKQMILEFVRR